MRPRKPGRPPRLKSAAEIRFELRLTDKERDRWQAAADRQGLALSELVRWCVEISIARGI
jgi:hypothetical protein